ncbi:two-component sensor histidine kinase [Actinomyces sp. Chiba101]|nr:two-component sensor histidine kinase [Actinomyces sp. Chiba101]GAV94633.1 hypothetical protein ADENT20671_1403 [Actinomyces denticolens]
MGADRGNPSEGLTGIHDGVEISGGIAAIEGVPAVTAVRASLGTTCAPGGGIGEETLGSSGSGEPADGGEPSWGRDISGS